MNPKIYVGNLPYKTTSEDLTALFETYGTIVDAKVIVDRETGRSKGFGFITFDSNEAAEAAVELNGTELEGRSIKVNPAKQDGDRGRGGRF